MALSKEEIKKRLHAMKVRQRMLKNIATIMAEKLDLRLSGLLKAHPKASPEISTWTMRLKEARLQQDQELIREVEWEYQRHLQANGWVEFWYRDAVEGAQVVSSRYDAISRALER